MTKFIVEVIILFLFSVLLIRLMGKSSLAQVTPHDLMAIILVVTMATQPILHQSLSRTLIGMSVVALLHILFSRFTLYKWMNRLFIGEPTLLIKHGKIIRENMKKSRYSLVELLASLRTAGYPNIHDIEYAILEPIGRISVIAKADKNPITPKDLKLNVSYQGLPMAIIIEGKVQEKNLRLIGKDREWLYSEIKAQGYQDVKDIFFASLTDKDVHLYIDNGNGMTGEK
ncbi:DUF421 domain-containing protein [Microaerobacter geothermalis]|uniref:DUF421 domain-containing protein n=1 Tax=Microaerobacter geothermalis TaxID=674972 RepID=UPI001F2A976C|nr:DUF421 domain-containing protein [Microaerobacter geothermalis]MCF6094969.1 DUF421 domain-containing protein [Microaerobacter geothermalis]